MDVFPLIIDGERVIGAGTMEVVDPANGKAFACSAQASPDQVDQAVDAAARAFPAWSAESDAARCAAVHAMAEVLEKHAEELASLLTREQGKPLNGMGSRFELGGAQAWAHATGDLDIPVEILQDNSAGRVELHRKALGVVGSITPWNWPLMIAIWHLAPAIRAGNTVLIKPSPLTPLSTLRMVELVSEVLPPGVVNAVSGTDETGKLITSHRGLRKITFTGSTAAGRHVMQSAASSLKRVTLELGGNDAGIVLPDADPASIVEEIFWGAFLNNGQTCAALKRLYVPEGLYDPMCDALVAFADTVPVGNGLEESNLLGPIQNRAQFDKVHTLVEDARAAGGTVLRGGQPMPGQGYFYPVTLISGLSNGSRIVDEEQFGPALPLISYRSVDEAVALANATDYGLGGSVWSPDLDEAAAVAQRLECGSVWVNRHGAIQPDVPFGGVKCSGIGVEFGSHGLEEFTSIQVLYR